MKNLLLVAITLMAGMSAQAQSNDENPEQISHRIIDEAIYYDGYQTKVIYDQDKDDGILRHSNDIYAVKLDDELLDKLGKDLRILVTLGARCDNYDRVGNLNIALVPKGSESYKYDEVQRCEIARYITPFMNKNRTPKEVPYEYDVPAVSMLLRDALLREKYDFWLESVVFGVPYAANEQITGCSNRTDVFSASVDFFTNPEPAGKVEDHVFVPIYTKMPEVHGPVNLNNYREQATDTLGRTTRTFLFKLPQDVKDARLTLISTSHGAGNNGEEYVRRQQLIYLDGEIILSYKPGGMDCEPYRKYNTQTNGIYGIRKRTDWEEWSNWCPGQAIPIRQIELGAMKAGEHKVMIRVPDAEFYGKDGDIRPSLYLQGTSDGTVPAGIGEILSKGPDVKFIRTGNTVRFVSEEPIAEITLHSYDGKLLYGKHNPGETLDISGFGQGAYILTLFTRDGRSSFTKIIK